MAGNVTRERRRASVMARREQGPQLFSPREALILAISVAGALLGLVALFAGWITP